MGSINNINILVKLRCSKQIEESCKKWNHKNTELWKFKTESSNLMANSKAQTHQSNGEQLSYSWLGTGIF